MEYSHKRAFTFIELIMTTMIIGVLSASGLYLLMYFVKNGVFIPKQLNMDMVVADALDVMIEGDNQARGLRFNRTITSIQDNQIVFTNHDGQSVRYRLDTVGNKLYRSINGAAEIILPYYVPNSGATLTALSNRLFTYYDASETVTAAPANVRWIAMTLTAATGTGLYADWEAKSQQSSAVAVNRFQ